MEDKIDDVECAALDRTFNQQLIAACETYKVNYILKSCRIGNSNPPPVA